LKETFEKMVAPLSISRERSWTSRIVSAILVLWSVAVGQ
jgi:hypothetical protein